MEVSLRATKSVADGAAATADSAGAAGAADGSFMARAMVAARRATVERPSTPMTALRVPVLSFGVGHMADDKNDEEELCWL